MERLTNMVTPARPSPERAQTSQSSLSLILRPSPPLMWVRWKTQSKYSSSGILRRASIFSLTAAGELRPPRLMRERDSPSAVAVQKALDGRIREGGELILGDSGVFGG